MSTPILATKLYTPPVGPKVIRRPRLIEGLNEGLWSQLTLVSAPAGFGKTTLVSEWIAAGKKTAAWLSLDEGDNDCTRFLAYLVAALRMIVPSVGEGVLRVLQSPQPPSVESALTTLINEIVAVPAKFTLVLDDYQVITAKTVDDALAFLLEYLPPQMRLCIVTREDPPLPLARLRLRGRLTEVRAADLRFTSSEAAEFLNQRMGLNLSEEDITLLATRTEGWIAGIQLAAISARGQKDVTGFIRSFTGGHHFVMDYLGENVLRLQSEKVQAFLLRTSILDRMCGPLCDAVLLDPSVSGQEILEYLEQANLFIVPLDDERRWYRYHHLFADLLRLRLQQSGASSTDTTGSGAAELHRRASLWYEGNGLEIEAFQHAVAAQDYERAERLMEGKGMPLYFRGAVVPVLNWLASLPTMVLDASPWLWVTYASVLLATGQTSGIEQKLQAAEAALRSAAPDDKTRDRIGRIAATRAMLALSRNQVETIIVQSRRALEYLRADNLPFRTSTIWKLGYAYQLQGDRKAADQAYTEVVSTGQTSGNIVFTLLAMTGRGTIQEGENHLYPAAQIYRRVLRLAGDMPLPAAVCEAQLGLARIFYEWNDLDAAGRHGQKACQLARQLVNTDRPVACEVFLARLRLARRDATGAAAILAEASQSARQHNLVYQMPEVAAGQVRTLLHKGDLTEAARLAEKHELPMSLARVHMARGDTTKALELLEALRRRAEAKGWEDERLKIMILHAIALHACAETEKAVHLLGEALALAEPGGFIRIFVDEGMPMAGLLSEAAARGIMPDYTARLLAVFEAEGEMSEDSSDRPPARAPIELLSKRELEVLRLIAQGFSNREIGERLFLSLSTVKGHNLKIFSKLQVQRRTKAVARARQLGLL